MMQAMKEMQQYYTKMRFYALQTKRQYDLGLGIVLSSKMFILLAIFVV
jgi:hypothetical protein